jgi:hypothetical protein
MGENVLAILRYLSSDASPLPSLTTGYICPTTPDAVVWEAEIRRSLAEDDAVSVFATFSVVFL